ncbi:MAG TPA: AraC family transcriptional regulator [Dongiaceae bacterium]|nr:AraC family transcriptional regulator [Dongiaceae bacterium]
METLAEIRALIARHAGPMGPSGSRATPLPGLRLIATPAPTRPANSVYEPALAVIAQGAKRAMLGDRTFDYGAGQYLIVSVDLPVVSRVVEASRRQPYLCVGITLDPAAVARLLLETAAGERVADDGDALGLAVSAAPPDLLDAVLRLLRLLDRPDDVPVLKPMLEREILWRLLHGGQGALVRQIGLADSSLCHIRRAVAVIRARYAETLRVEELAGVAGMSPASFYRHFKSVTAVSPLQYQKQIRLLEARARLIAGPQNVAAIGFDVGYESPSQFSREYSRLFGAPPARDLARLRGQLPPEQDTA